MKDKDLQSLGKAYQMINENDKLQALKSFSKQENFEQRTRYLQNRIVDFFHKFDDFLSELYDDDFQEKEYMAWLRGVLKNEIEASKDAKSNADNIYGFVRVLEDAAEELKKTLEGTIEENNKLEGLKSFAQNNKEISQFAEDVKNMQKHLDKNYKILKKHQQEMVSNMNSAIENLSPGYNEGTLTPQELKEFENAMNLELLPDYLDEYAGMFRRLIHG